MKNAGLVFVTDYGIVKCGPGFMKIIERIQPGLDMGYRTKARKAAIQRFGQLEQAAMVLAEAAWLMGTQLKATP